MCCNEVAMTTFTISFISVIVLIGHLVILQLQLFELVCFNGLLPSQWSQLITPYWCQFVYSLATVYCFYATSKPWL